MEEKKSPPIGDKEDRERKFSSVEVTVDDSINAIRDVGGRLNVLYHAAGASYNNYEDLFACMEMTRVALKNEVKTINRIMEELTKPFDDIEFTPIGSA